MNDRQQASKILQGLAPHVARRAAWRAGWLRALRAAEAAKQNVTREKVATDLINAARRMGKRAPCATTIFLWERAEELRGFAGLVDRRHGPRPKNQQLPTTQEVERFDAQQLAELLVAIAARLRATVLPAKPQADNDTKGLYTRPRRAAVDRWTKVTDQGSGSPAIGTSGEARRV